MRHVQEWIVGVERRTELVIPGELMMTMVMSKHNVTTDRRSSVTSQLPSFQTVNARL